MFSLVKLCLIFQSDGLISFDQPIYKSSPIASSQPTDLHDKLLCHGNYIL